MHSETTLDDNDGEFLKVGFLHKRRNGLAKHMSGSWVLRHFTLTRAGMLSYYELSYAANADLAVMEKPARGRIDLASKY